MAPATGSKRNKGAGRSTANNLPLKERLKARGAFTEATVDQTRSTGNYAPLFSPVKPTRRSVKGKTRSQTTDANTSKTVMHEYFPRKSVSGRSSLAHSRSHPKGSGKEDSFAFMLDPEEVARVKKKSAALLVSLTGEEADCSDVQIVDTASLDRLQGERATVTDGDAVCIPLLYNPRGASYAMMRLPPLSHFGPFINTGGVMVLVFIDVPVGKLFYESLNLTGKRRIACPRQAHVLVLPDDVFKLHNESDAAGACVIVLSCRKDGKEFNIEQHVQGAFLTPVR
ncbi:uncharacterized protein BcabD6B2_02260 [Babesia caballi]|uniref:Uncharacterized protein n=1 Tax=Babesia caballi TaxID=5871 RepID=A0AAV4LNX8_BABCB|nr:hypothetical protein, conserved [Babesia caballi]